MPGNIDADPGSAALVLNAAQATDVSFGYRIGCHRFVLDNAMLSELVVKPAIYPIPKSPAWLCGVINLRGNILAVVDLSATLSTVCNSAPGDFVLVIDKGSEAVALLVDAPPAALAHATAITASSAAAGLQSDFIHGGVEAENQLWLQLDIKGMVRHLRANH
jgi:chemotaxis signal transduction protein